MSSTSPVTKKSKKADRNSVGDYVGENILGTMITGRMASLSLHSPQSEQRLYSGGIHLRGFAELEISGTRFISSLNDKLSSNRLYIQMFATLLLGLGTLTAVIPATVMGAYEKNSTHWHLTLALIICCTAFSIFVVTELVNLTLWRVSSPRLLRMIGLLSLGVAKAHPSLVHAGGLYGVLARRSLHRSGLGIHEQETFVSMIGEWEGTTEELYRFAKSLES
jgi:hypothetical protein